MTPKLLLVVGYPGAGKTSTVQACLATWQRAAARSPFAHEALLDANSLVGWHLGATRADGMSGTDALSMSVQPKVLAWLRDPWVQQASWCLAEGDRLATRSFLTGAQAAGWQPQLVLLDVAPDVARLRALARGSTQQASWVAGRITKVGNLVRWARTEGLPVHVLDGTPEGAVAPNAERLQKLLAIAPR